MSVSAARAYAFYKDVAKNQKVYTVKDAGGYPAPKNSEGKRCMPFWSTRSRAEKIIKNVPAYKDFEIEEISFEEFGNKWIPDLKEDGFQIGVNWAGDNATGYDLDPDFVLRCVNAKLPRKRIHLKPGDVFECPIKGGKRVFQFLVKDKTCLNGHVIRCFKKIYKEDEEIDFDKALKDKILFHMQTFILIGRNMGIWERIGNREVDEKDIPYFRTTNDSPAEVAISRNWYVWKPNEPHKKVGRLNWRTRKYATGGVLMPHAVKKYLEAGKILRKHCK